MVVYLAEVDVSAIGTNSMAELRIRTVADVELKLVPLSTIVANSLAVGARGLDAFQRLYLFERLAQFIDQLLPLSFHAFALADIPQDRQSIGLPVKLYDVRADFHRNGAVALGQENSFKPI